MGNMLCRYDSEGGLKGDLDPFGPNVIQLQKIYNKG